MAGCVADTETVDLTVASGVLSADVKISGDSGNGLSAHGDGLFVTGPVTDAAAGTGSLRTLGAGAQQAAAGNDKRFPTEATSLPGTPVDGQVVKLRLGGSPFVFVTMTWDATYGHWVSGEDWSFAHVYTAGGFTGTDSAFGGVLLRYSELAAALDLQMRALCFAGYRGGGSGALMKPEWRSCNAGDAVDAWTRIGSGHFLGRSDDTAVDSGWTDVAAASADVIELGGFLEGQSGDQEWGLSRASIGVRWIA